MKKTRKIGDERFRDLGRGYSAKSEAQHFASQLRGKGNKVRVIPKKGGWFLYGKKK